MVTIDVISDLVAGAGVILSESTSGRLAVRRRPFLQPILSPQSPASESMFSLTRISVNAHYGSYIKSTRARSTLYDRTFWGSWTRLECLLAKQAQEAHSQCQNRL